MSGNGRESAHSGNGRGVSSHEESKAAALGEVFDGEEGKVGDKVTLDMKMDLIAKVKKLSNEGLTKLV